MNFKFPTFLGIIKLRRIDLKLYLFISLSNF